MYCKETDGNFSGFELIYAVLNYGSGTKFLHQAKKYNIQGGTIIYGRGTVNNSILKFFSLYDERKEIVLMGAESKRAAEALEKLNRDFKLEKPNHGIIFSTNVSGIIGSSSHNESKCKNGGNNSMYKNIITIVKKGSAEDVVEAAQQAGSKGGTIINARGSGVHECVKVFGMDIEPEREIVMILIKEDLCEAVTAAIRSRLDIDKPGNGIIFIQDIERAYGVYDC